MPYPGWADSLRLGRVLYRLFGLAPWRFYLSQFTLQLAHLPVEVHELLDIVLSLAGEALAFLFELVDEIIFAAIGDAPARL
ncbi:MAG: hypothetical protein HY043_08140 [Verrucomicrobia bacterium]|nr:hypothetical protein [Verrucomicrobiota bacterium]